MNLSFVGSELLSIGIEFLGYDSEVNPVFLFLVWVFPKAGINIIYASFMLWHSII